MKTTGTEKRKFTDLNNPELIASLLYAATIGAMFSHIIEINENYHWTLILNTVLIVILVFIDWNNRIFVPAQLISNAKNKKILRSFKLFFEVIGMVLLVLFFNKFINFNVKKQIFSDIFFLFGTYLIITGIWNLVIISLMEGIELKDLARKIFNLVSDTKGLKDVLGKNKIPNLEIEKKEFIEKLEKGDDELMDTIKYFFKKIKSKLPSPKRNAKIIIIQFIGNHIIWFNIFIGLVLLLFSFKEIFHLSNSILIFKKYFLLIRFYMLLISFLIILIISMLCNFKKDITKNIFGLSFVVLLLSIYLYFSVTSLFYVVVIQQISIGIGIEYLTDGNFFS